MKRGRVELVNARLLLRWSEFESCLIVQFFCKICVGKEQK